MALTLHKPAQSRVRFVHGCFCAFLLCLVTTGCQGVQNGTNGPDRATLASLLTALKKGDEGAIEDCLSSLQNVNARDRYGMTALLQSILVKNKGAYTKLLARGADPNLCDREGRCVMNVAAAEEDTSWLVAAIEHNGNPNALNLGNTFISGGTPLFYSIFAERTKSASILIAAGANVKHTVEAGVNPLRAAAGTGNYEVVFLLLNAGADPLQSDHHGATLIDWFDGRGEELVPDKEQIPWFHKVRNLLIERGLLTE